jgi:dTDP-glucose 4,6-dehydratase
VENGNDFIGKRQMRILITGASGFVGQHRVNHLRKLKHQVISISRARNFQANYSYIEEIAEPHSIDYIVSRHKIDRIEHYASLSTVGASRKNPFYTYKVNVLGTVSVLETAKEFKIPTMVFTTDKVYGYASQIADEGTFLQPDVGEYENSKTLQDMVAQSYNLKLKNITIIRSCNIFGPNDSNPRIIPNTIDDLQNNKPPVIFSNIHTIRQFIYIKDLMKAIDVILEKSQGDIFNIGTDDYVSQENVVKIIVKLWNEKYHTNVVPIYKEGPDLKELKAQMLIWEKLKALGWRPEYRFENAIKEMI